MTTREFSNGFDTLLNSYSSQGPFGTDASKTNLAFDEYEKSQFLTEAQEQLVLSYYNGKNTAGESFEKTEEVRRYLSSLIKTDRIFPESSTEDLTLKENSQVFSLPEKLWFITYEAASLVPSSDSCLDEREIKVVPVTQDDLYRTLENPFKGTGYRRALRLDIANNKVELISKYKIKTYIIRYINKINPIILTDLSEEGLSIDNKTQASTCELHESLHRTILELAVKLALQSKGIQLQ